MVVPGAKWWHFKCAEVGKPMSSNVGGWLGTAFLAISSVELSAVLSHEHTYLSVPPARFSESACFGSFPVGGLGGSTTSDSR